jgi:hypothetical protein
MEYKVNTSLNVGDKLYKLTERGTILQHYVSTIEFEGTIENDCNYHVLYCIYNSFDKFVCKLKYNEITDLYFLNKKDIVKRVMDQL